MTQVVQELVAITLRMDQVRPDPDQPRKVFRFRPLRELFRSIKEGGLKDPIHVKSDGGEGYLIVDGERRWRCMRALHAQEIRCYLMPSDTDTLIYGLVTLLVREGLSPMEAAWAYRQLIDKGMTQSAIGRKLGKTQTQISASLALLRLPESLQNDVARGRMVVATASVLVRRCSDAEDMGATWEAFRKSKDFSPGKLTAASLTNFIEERKRLARLKKTTGLDPSLVVAVETAANVLPAAQRLLGALERFVGGNSEQDQRQFREAWDGLGIRARGDILSALREINAQTRRLTERLQVAERTAQRNGGGQ
ncbi:MAG: ParB/RepB/Spo0J family partition protein [bacterium]|nr:ParB/RepB/Spo0J family partition protein [bacterium]